MFLAHGIHRLVLLRVAGVIRDVGRQRDVPRGVDRLIEGARLARSALALRCEAHETSAAAIGHEVHDLARKHHGSAFRRMEPARAVLDHRTRLQALARVHQAFPHMSERVDVLAAVEQQGLGHATGLRLRPMSRAGMTRVSFATSKSPGSR